MPSTIPGDDRTSPPVWNAQWRIPSRTSSATMSPAASPTTTRPPPTAGDVFAALPSCLLQRWSPVAASNAVTLPPASATYTTPATTAGMLAVIAPPTDRSQMIVGCPTGPGPSTRPVRLGPPRNIVASVGNTGLEDRSAPTAMSRPASRSRPTRPTRTRTRIDELAGAGKTHEIHRRRCEVTSTVARIDDPRSLGATTCGAGVSAVRMASSVSENWAFIAVPPSAPSRARRAHSRAAT